MENEAMSATVLVVALLAHLAGFLTESWQHLQVLP